MSHAGRSSACSARTAPAKRLCSASSRRSRGRHPAPLEVRRRISVVIQETAVELFLTVRDNLGTFARFHGLGDAGIRTRAERVLEDFGLASEAHRKVMDLSGGYRRRVQVAKVFMVDTPVVFLDEFSTGMDPVLKRSVMSMLRAEAS